MPVPSIVMEPRANFGATDPSISTAPAGLIPWQAMKDDWGNPTPATGVQTSTPFAGGSGGAYACKLDQLVDEFLNPVRPATFEDHQLRIVWRNDGSDLTAKFRFGAALLQNPFYTVTRTMTSTVPIAEIISIPASNISTGLTGEANYNNINLFFFADQANAPNPSPPSIPNWRIVVYHMSLVVPDPKAYRATQSGMEYFIGLGGRLAATRGGLEFWARSGIRGTREAVEFFVKTRHRATRLGMELWVRDTKPLRATREAVEFFVKATNAASRATREGIEFFCKVLRVNSTRHAAEFYAKRQGAAATRHATEFFVKYTVSTGTAAATRGGAEFFLKIPFARDSVEPLPLPSVMANLLRADWGAELTVESAYSTDVTRSATTIAEERRGLVDRPYRTVGIRFVGHDSDRALQHIMNLARLGHTRTVLPLYMDQAPVKRMISTSFIGCDTLYRRFHRGQRIVIHNWADRIHPAGAEYAVIKSVNAEGLELTAPLAGSFGPRSRVYPLIDAEISLEGRQGSLTDNVGRVPLIYNEVVGRSALPALATGDPAEPRHSDGFPILELSPDWAGGIESRIVRYGSQLGSGRGLITDLAGERPVFAHSIPLVFTKRSQFWRVLSFFDTRMGRLRTFWTVWPQSLFTVSAIVGPTQIDLRQSGNIADIQAFVKALAIVRADGGRVSIHRISSVAVNGLNWRVTLVEPLPVTSPSEVRRVTAAVFGRLTSDSFVERWSTDQTCEASLEVVELLEEKAVAIPGVVEGYTPAGPDAVPNLFAWFDATAGTWTSPSDMAGVTILRTSKATPGKLISTWDDFRTPLGALPTLAGAALQVDRPKLVQFDNAALNNNRRTMRFDAGPRNFRLRTSDVSDLAAPFWDDTASNMGFTIFMNLRFTAEDTLERKLIQRTNIVEWTSKTVKLFEDDGSGAVTLTLPPGWAQGSSLRTLALVWKPNDYIRLYSNGGAPVVQESATKIVDLPPVARITDVCKWEGSAISETDEFSIGLDPFVNSIIFYKRALGATALNGVGTFLQNAFATPWATVV